MSVPDPIMLFSAVGATLFIALLLWLALEFRERSRKP